jgi:hypothetical protein
MAKEKPKSVNPQRPAGNALKRGSDESVQDISEEPLKENVDESAMSGGSSVQDMSENPLKQVDKYVAESGISGELDRTVDQSTIADTLQAASRGSAEEVRGEISSEERRRMIEEAAYDCSRRRQQEGRQGSAADDWAEAEAQIDRLLQERRNRKQD